MMAVMMVQAQQRPLVQINNPAASQQNPGPIPISFNPAAVLEEDNFEAPATKAGEAIDDSLVRTKRGGHKGGYYGGYYNRGYYGYRYPYYSYNNG